MSFLNTLSVFYYGTTITKENQNLNFDEGLGELTAVIPVGDYTLTEFVAAIQTAMILAGTQAYVVSLNRTTRKITISAPLTFDLMSFTGSQVGTSPWELMGFSILVNKTGLLTYTGEAGAGFEYRPQLIFNEYIQLEDYEVKESAVVNVSVNGVVQTLQYGDGQRMQCNIRGVTNLLNLKTTPFYENATGLQDMRNFMKYLITKAKIEFMPDVADRSTFFSLLLESTPASKDGTKFMINHMDGANKFFESGALTFRKVIE